MANVDDIVRGLTKAQSDMLSGRYDPEFARIEDAAALERMGLWAFDPAKQGADSEYYEMDITPLGLDVRACLLSSSGATDHAQ